MEQNTIHFIARRILLTIAVLLACSTTAIASPPTHRYSFDSNADDSLGSANGTLLGNATITNGMLVLNGTNGCVKLPDGMFTNYTSLTFELWVILNSANAGNRLFSFESIPTGGIVFPVGSGYSAYYLASGYGTQSVPSPALSTGTTNHVVWTQAQPLHASRIFVNGDMVEQNTNFSLTPELVGLTTNNYLGAYRTNLSVLKGEILEFRTYSNALTSFEVLQSKAAGPEQLSIVNGVRLVTSPFVPLGSLPIKVYADFQHASNVDITGLAGTISSSDTNVIAIASNELFHAVGLGTASISVNYEGHLDSKIVTVLSAEDFSLAHRYDFTGTLGQKTIIDSQGEAHGMLVGSGSFTNGGQLYMAGGTLSYTGGYVDLPDGILSSLEEVTVEAWLTRIYSTSSPYWPRIFDFGSQLNGVGQSYFFLSPAVAQDNLTNDVNLIRFSASTNGILAESPRLTAHPMMETNVETHFAVSYSPARNLSKLYENGVLVSSGLAPIPLNAIVDTNNWLGRSQFNGDGSFPRYFNEFRIYRKALDDSDIAASYALGPDVIGADYALHARASHSNLVLSWGPSAFWCVLKTSASIGPEAVWNNADVSAAFTNGQFQATLPIGDSERFFKLDPP